MELSWLMRLRIAAVAAVGVILIGILGWPLAAPAEPLGVVSVFADGISSSDAIILIILAGLAFLAGFTGYFLSRPYGREIGVLAVPSGLALWAVRSGSMASLCQQNPTLAQRQAIFATLKWEPIFWLAIVAAGLLGVLIGRKISQPKTGPDKKQKKANSVYHGHPGRDITGWKPVILNAAIALVGSVLIAQFLISIFAQDVRIFDPQLGSVIAQPAIGQIVFAVSVSFGLVAFVVKKFLNVSYIWPIIASALVTGFAITIYIKQDILQYLVGHHPAVFFSSAVISILPVQMVAFGTLGAITGYWLAVRYEYWRKHESK